MSRIYEELKCGCLISCDGGGGLIPHEYLEIFDANQTVIPGTSKECKQNIQEYSKKHSPCSNCGKCEECFSHKECVTFTDINDSKFIEIFQRNPDFRDAYLAAIRDTNDFVSNKKEEWKNNWDLSAFGACEIIIMELNKVIKQLEVK